MYTYTGPCDLDPNVCQRRKSHWLLICVVCTALALIAALSLLVLLKTGLLGPGNATAINETEVLPKMWYRVGVGRADMTGPPVQIRFMGYADMDHVGEGLHTRQWARSFIIDNNDTKVVLVSAEIHVVGIALRREVVRKLQRMYGQNYTLRNVFIAATHTHSTPGGFLGDFLLDVSVLGFSNEVFYAYANGIINSIIRAHANIKPANLYFSQTRVWNQHINRSPFAYAKNPKDERAKYDYNTDNLLSQIRVVDIDKNLLGVMSWFAIHANSINITNRLLSTDNLGFAAIALEKTLNPGSFVGKGPIVGAFFVGNAGDVSPNTRGAHCRYTGTECDNHFLKCPAYEECSAQGPGGDMFESAKLIGSGIYLGAMKALYLPKNRITLLEGHLAVLHQFVQMANEEVTPYSPVEQQFYVETARPATGCVPCFGEGFATGHMDGMNFLNVDKGVIIGNDLVDAIRRGTLRQHIINDINCHYPKKIYLATGRADFPIPWHHLASVTLLNIGGITIAGVPGEPTTMAGRRIRQVVSMATGEKTNKCIVMGLTNEYIHYITTRHEYHVQTFEGASTIYGPYTLDILLKKYNNFAELAMEKEADVDPGPDPAYYKDQGVSLVIPAFLDEDWDAHWPIGSVWNTVDYYYATETTASATFGSANPRNDLLHEGTYFTVQAYKDGSYEDVFTDADWETRFIWEWPYDGYKTRSKIYIKWDIPASTPYTYYRFRYYPVERTRDGRARYRGWYHTRAFFVSHRDYYDYYINSFWKFFEKRK